MMEPLVTTHAAIAMIVVGYTLVGLMIGWIVGYSRAEKRGYARERAAVDYYIKLQDRTRAALNNREDTYS